MRRIILCITILIGYGCASETQRKGLDIIADHYEATTAFSKGFNTNAGKTTTMFTIKVSNSKMIDTLRPDITASNIALMLYETFTEEERESYNEIQVALVKDSLKEAETSRYDPSVLADALDQSAIFRSFSDNLINKDLGSIAENMAPQYKTDKLLPNLTNYMTALVNTHGKLEGYKRTGFGILSLPDNRKLFFYSGYLIFEDGVYRGYNVQTSQNMDNNYLMGFKFDEY